MIVVKSIIAGLAFLVGAAVLLLLAVIVYFSAVQPPEGEEAIGFDPVSFARVYPLVWALPVLAFLLGFSWEYRRVRRRQAG